MSILPCATTATQDPLTIVPWRTVVLVLTATGGSIPARTPWSTRPRLEAIAVGRAPGRGGSGC